ncbi:MAG: hypothetical protein AB1Z38_10920 [Desulfotignum sp.]
MNHIIKKGGRSPTGPFAGTLNENGKGIIFHKFPFEIKIFKFTAGMLDIIQDPNSGKIPGPQLCKLTISNFFPDKIGIGFFVFTKDIQGPFFQFLFCLAKRSGIADNIVKARVLLKQLLHELVGFYIGKGMF